LKKARGGTFLFQRNTFCLKRPSNELGNEGGQQEKIILGFHGLSKKDKGNNHGEMGGGGGGGHKKGQVTTSHRRKATPIKAQGHWAVPSNVKKNQRLGKRGNRRGILGRRELWEGERSAPFWTTQNFREKNK